MGTGKTTVGQLVAAQLRFRLVDTDELIESRTGRSITRLFADEGEDRFRQYETRIVEELKTWENTVIAAGGGLIVNAANLASLQTHALVVCLWASPQKIWERVGHQSHRPLLQVPDPQTRIRELLDARAPFYRRADVLVNTELRSVKEVAHHVIHQFQLARNESGHR